VTTTGPPVSRARAGRDIVGQVVLRTTNLALGIAVTVLVVRTLGDEGFGQWSTLLAILGFTGYFSVLGLQQVAVERAAADAEHAPEWLGALVTLRLALSGPATLLALAVCLWVSEDHTMRVAAVLACATLPVTVASALRAVFQLRVRNTAATAIEVAHGVLWLGAVALVALLDGGVVAIAAALLAVTTAANLATVVLALRTAPVRLRGARSRSASAACSRSATDTSTR
jgi:O-antigen/teichoic acid export membrane protein